MFDMFYTRDDTDGLGRPSLISDPSIVYDPRKHDYFALEGMHKILDHTKGPVFRDVVGRSRGLRSCRTWFGVISSLS